MPYRPIIASNSATPPKMLKRVAPVRMIHKSALPSRCCRIVLSESTGSAGVELADFAAHRLRACRLRSSPSGGYACRTDSPRRTGSRHGDLRPLPTTCSCTFPTMPTTSISRGFSVLVLVQQDVLAESVAIRPEAVGGQAVEHHRGPRPAPSAARNARPRSSGIPMVWK